MAFWDMAALKARWAPGAAVLFSSARLGSPEMMDGARFSLVKG